MIFRLAGTGIGLLLSHFLGFCLCIHIKAHILTSRKCGDLRHRKLACQGPIIVPVSWIQVRDSEVLVWWED